jgi:superfamily II DNA or RNA helicase
MGDSESDSEGPLLHTSDDIDAPAREVIEDLTGEDEILSDQSSLLSLSLSDGTPNIKPRAYQIEMLEESLKRNIIVAADTGSGKTHM